MKLKKIASLMLAGIMAVSMLAGCKSGTPNPNPGEGEGEGNTATGYSATLGDKVSDDVKKLDYITFADNAADAAALEDAVGNLGLVNGATAVLPETLINLKKDVNGLVLPEGVESIFDDRAVVAMIDNFAEAVESQNLWLDVEGIHDDAFDWTNHDRKTYDDSTCAALFVIGSSVKMDKALDQVAAAVEDQLAALPNVDMDTDGTASVTYDYTVSVSVVEKPVSAIDWLNASANFIAVTVTRSATQE